MIRTLTAAVLTWAVAFSASAQQSPPSEEALRMERTFWETIRASTDPADFRAYLQRYPNGTFADLARNRLAALGDKGLAAGEPAAASRGLPSEGDSWTYRLTEPQRTDGPKQRRYAVKVIAASDAEITEQFTVEHEGSGQAMHRGQRELMALGRQLFSPYLLAFGGLASGGPRVHVSISDPACARYVCDAVAFVAAWETIEVPAGKFDTVKVEIRENWRPGGAVTFGAGGMHGGRILHAWYSYATKRVVKYASRSTFGSTPPIDTDFELVLESYQLK